MSGEILEGLGGIKGIFSLLRKRSKFSISSEVARKSK